MSEIHFHPQEVLIQQQQQLITHITGTANFNSTCI